MFRCNDSHLQIDSAVYNVTGKEFNDSVTYRCLDAFNHTSGDLYRRYNHLENWTGTSPTSSEFTTLKHIHSAPPPTPCIILILNFTCKLMIYFKKVPNIFSTKINDFFYFNSNAKIYFHLKIHPCTCR